MGVQSLEDNIVKSKYQKWFLLLQASINTIHMFLKKNMDLLHFYRKTKIKKIKKVVVILIIRQREKGEKDATFHLEVET